MKKRVDRSIAFGVVGWLFVMVVVAAQANALEFSNCYGKAVGYSLSGATLGPHQDKLCTDPERAGTNFRSPGRVHSGNRIVGGELVLSGSMHNSCFSRIDGKVTLEVDGEKDEQTLSFEKGEGAFKVSVRVPADAKGGRFSIRHVGVNPYGNIVSAVSGNLGSPESGAARPTNAEPKPEPPPSKELVLELNITDGQVFTQGDSMSVMAWVRRGQSDPVAGAAVEIRVFSPAGRLNGSAVMYTDAKGQGRMTRTLPWWPAFFTVCATPGTWRVEADVRVDREMAKVTRKVELVEFKVTTAQAAANIWRIVNMWERGVLAVTVRNGVDEPFIAALRGPKGPMVTMRAAADAKFRPYTNGALTADTLRWLNGMRFHSSAATRRFLAGIDYGPVYTGAGLGQMAVAIYPRGGDWEQGHVLDAWWHQEKRAHTAGEWMSLFGFDQAVQRFPGSRWSGQYPTTGSDGGYYPAPDEGGGRTDLFGRSRVLTYSPVELLATDGQGRRAGRLPDGSFINEIPGAEHVRGRKEDGTFVNLVSLPEGRYEVGITGTDNGTFHLEAGTTEGIACFGRQPVKRGQQATLSLAPGEFAPSLLMPDGKHIQPQPNDAIVDKPAQASTPTPVPEPANQDEWQNIRRNTTPPPEPRNPHLAPQRPPSDDGWAPIGGSGSSSMQDKSGNSERERSIPKGHSTRYGF